MTNTPIRITDTDDGPVWLAERRKGLGGSDAVVLMGAGQYEDETPYFVWLKKVEGYDIPTTPVMERGHALEPIAADMYAKDSGHTLIETGMWAHPDHPMILGSPDRIVVDDDGNWIGGWEGKTTNSRVASKWGPECPARFEWQVRHYMAILGLPWFDVTALVVDTWEVYHWRVERDMGKERALIAACTEFWRTYIEPGIPPEVDERITPAEISYRWAEPTEGVLDLDSLSAEGQRVSALLAERSELQQAAKQARDRLKEIDDALKVTAGEHEEVAVDGARAYTWRSQTRTTVDTKRLREDLPEVAEQYQRSTTFRVLNV